MPKADDAPQPRAQLNTLPDKLKAYMAHLCAKQDVAIRKALADCRERFKQSVPPRPGPLCVPVGHEEQHRSFVWDIKGMANARSAVPLPSMSFRLRATSRVARAHRVLTLRAAP